MPENSVGKSSLVLEKVKTTVLRASICIKPGPISVIFCSTVRSCVLEEIEYVQHSSKAKQLTEKQAEVQQLFFELRKQSEDRIVTRSSWYKALESKNIATSDVAKKRLLDLMVEMGTFTVQGEGRDVYFTTKTHIDFEVS